MNSVDQNREDQSRENQRFVYWFTAAAFDSARNELKAKGYRLRSATLTPCQVLLATGLTLVYARPEKWNGLCNRQGSWYRSSHRLGQTMLVADHLLPKEVHEYLDVQIEASDFIPEVLPTEAQLRELVQSAAYVKKKPDGWERVTWRDSTLFKILFSLTRFWRRGEGLRTHWLGHRANHANFLARRFTTRLDGENVPYSVTENAGVCSSCAEFFNINDPDRRKLVRACPGSISLAGAERDIYYDVRPVPLTVSADSHR